MSLERVKTGAAAGDQDNYLRRVHPAGWHNPTPRAQYDLVIVGAGPAGLAAAEAAVRLGLSIALVERACIGGNSLNLGSVPLKVLVRSGNLLAGMRDAVRYGVAHTGTAQADLGAVMLRMRRIRSRIAEVQSVERLRACGIDVFFGEARFAGKNRLQCGTQQLKFRKALVATGARPKATTIPGFERIGYLTSATIFDGDALPGRLAIVGGGPLGCELAQTLARLGSQVTIVQNEPKFLPLEERDAAEILSRSLARDGVVTRLNTTVVGVRECGGRRWLDTVSNGAKNSIAADAIFLGIGRTPNVEELGLEAALVDYAAHEGIKVDEHLRTTNPHIYAAGDVCLRHKFTNVAQASARLAVANAFAAKRRRQPHWLIPRCTHCDPQIAHIGMHVRQARQRAIAVHSFTIMMQDVDGAIIDGTDVGFVKIHVRAGSDEILGATVVATRASDMINELSVIMHGNIGMRRLADILHSYPAQSDAIRLAAVAWRALHGSAVPPAPVRRAAKAAAAART
ncbi:MAG TPA: FAD-dependent oxidoreductase [Steroidobacteraceae bacterium]|nr:FAD-dependent oxidoreductase [Steroidobacteraceae bacterium]